MFGLSPAWSLGIKLALALAVAGALAWLWGEHNRANRLAVTVKAYERCESAVLGKPVKERAQWRNRAPPQPDSPSEVCPPGIASAAAIAANALECSATLDGSKPYASVSGAVRLACSAGVQRLYVDWGARDREVKNLRAELDAAESRAGRAIARAQAQARTEAERKALAENERRAARDDRGQRACDAECMRKRSEGYVAPPG